MTNTWTGSWGQSLIVIVVGWYFAWSMLAFFVFMADKRAARRHRRRVPERTLHLTEVLGGFPGAFIAIFMLRHKSSKPSFLIVSIFASVVNLVMLYLLYSLFIRK